MRLRVVLVLLFVLALIVPAQAAQAKTKKDRVIKDSRIEESSGLAPSLLHDDVLWTHNDSGNPNEIFAIAKSGKTAATLTIAGEDARDWEGITSFRGPANGPAAGKALLAIGDIGDNDAKHDSVRIAIVEEPADLADATLDPVRVLRLTYPDGPRDAEALLADPRTGRLYVVTKRLFGSEVYTVPPRVWPGKGATGTSALTPMTPVAQTNAALVTDGAFLPDGTMLLRGYGTVTVVAAPDTAENGRLKTLASESLPDQEQGESIAVVDDSGYALIGSEGENSPILRTRVPQVPGASATSSTEPEPSASSDQIASETAERLRNLAGDDIDLRLWAGIGAAAVVVVALLGAAMWLRPKRSRRRRR